MNPVERLATNLLSESRAYGYTLCIWGGGEMLITQYGTPDLVDIVVFVAGAVVGFGALAAIAFNAAFAAADADHESSPMVASMVHVVATLGSVLASHLVAVVALGYGIPAAVAFATVGFQATTTYNSLLLFEQAAVRLFA
ncbi:hypothetical protein [Halococcus agarilyticus]|uniref:hypothetical protein n=1 Tax=Halococcus agarilyticus TaxID=1232219 RepID=UPI0006776551|nr:hypothetical protein [Halococcus agarilyticus]